MSKIINIILYIFILLIIIFGILCLWTLNHYLQYRDYYEYLDFNNIVGRSPNCFIENDIKYCRILNKNFKVKNYKKREERR